MLAREEYGQFTVANAATGQTTYEYRLSRRPHASQPRYSVRERRNADEVRRRGTDHRVAERFRDPTRSFAPQDRPLGTRKNFSCMLGSKVPHRCGVLHSAGPYGAQGRGRCRGAGRSSAFRCMTLDLETVSQGSHCRELVCVDLPTAEARMTVTTYNRRGKIDLTVLIANLTHAAATKA